MESTNMEAMLRWEYSLTLEDIDAVAEVYTGERLGVSARSVDYIAALIAVDSTVPQWLIKEAMTEGIQRSLPFHDVLHDSGVEEYIDLYAVDLITEARRFYNYHVSRNLGLSFEELTSHRPGMCQYTQRVARRLGFMQ